MQALLSVKFIILDVPIKGKLSGPAALEDVIKVYFPRSTCGFEYSVALIHLVLPGVLVKSLIGNKLWPSI